MVENTPVERYTQDRQWGLLGERVVNVVTMIDDNPGGRRTVLIPTPREAS